MPDVYKERILNCSSTANPKIHIPSSLMTICLRCEHCYYGLLHFSRSDLCLSNPAASSKPRPQGQTLHAMPFQEDPQADTGIFKSSTCPHAGGFLGIVFLLSWVLQSSCVPCSVTSHSLFAACYSPWSLLCEITTSFQLTKPGDLLTKVLPDRGHETTTTTNNKVFTRSPSLTVRPPNKTHRNGES